MQLGITIEQQQQSMSLWFLVEKFLGTPVKGLVANQDENWCTFFESLDTLRAALFLWITPFDAALSMQVTAALKAC
jgi:hypothetical protein